MFLFLQARKKVKITLYNKRYRGIIIYMCNKYISNKSTNKRDSNIFDAIIQGDLSKIKAMIDQDKNIVNEQNHQSYIPLHFAVIYNKLEIIKLLITNGADINAKDNQKHTPLFLAVTRCHLPIVEVLSEHDADINTQSNFNSPLFLAFKEQQEYIAEILTKALLDSLIKKNTSVDIMRREINNVLKFSLQFNCLKVFQYLVNQHKDYVHVQNESGETPLHLASRYGCLKAVEFLVNNNCSVDIQNKHKETPLHLAALYGHCVVVKYLVNNKANIHIKNEDNETPLDLAVKYQYSDIKIYLQEKNVNSDIKVVAIHEFVMF